MHIAEDILQQATAVRAKLQEVVKNWERDRIQHGDLESQTTRLERMLLADADLRRTVAEAMDWSPPASGSLELVLLAADAVRGKIPQPPKQVFGDDFNWEAWKAQPDAQQLQVLFELNKTVRTAFAKAVGAYPSKSFLADIARNAMNEIRANGPSSERLRYLLLSRLLNWDSFQTGQQDQLFLGMLKQDFAFRERVAKAIKYQSEEAKKMAGFAVSIWKTTPRESRRLLLSKLERLDGRLAQPDSWRSVLDIFKASADYEPTEESWRRLQINLTEAFAETPMLPSILWDEMEWPRPFALVLREELVEIETKRRLCQYPGEIADPAIAPTAVDASDLAAYKKLFGVAFSGGGIRSATFNLGVLQKLSDFGLLGKVDYLSTVSGGGYIGAWLAAWIKKNDDATFQDCLPKMKNLLSPGVPDPRDNSQKPIRFLREFSNYLTPRLGGFSYDTWTLAAVYSRNVVLNQGILIAVLGTVLLLPRILILPMLADMWDWWMLIVAIATILLAVFCMSLNMRNAVAPTVREPGSVARKSSEAGLEEKKGVPDWFFETESVQALVVGSLLVSVYFGSVWVWRHLPNLDEGGKWFWILTSIFAALSSLLLSLVGGFWDQVRSRQIGNSKWVAMILLVLVTVLSSGATVGLFHVYMTLMRKLYGMNSGVWHAEIWGPIMLLTMLIIPGTLQVGLMGIDYPDPGREWLSRLRAVASVWVAQWIALMSTVIYGPWLMLKVTGWTVKGLRVWISGLTLGWIITTVSGLAAGKSRKTGVTPEGRPTFSWLEMLAKAGPPVFVTGLVLFIATMEFIYLVPRGNRTVSHMSTFYWTYMQPSHTVWLMFGLLGLAGVLLAWRVDINEFSMHHFYKNRLVRCYMGASNTERKPNPFTGFDTQDDFHLSQLRATDDRKPYLGPYPLINATLNLSIGKQLAWQERKGASFIFSPRFCGFDVQGWAIATGSKAGRPTTDEPPRKRNQALKTLGPLSLRETLRPHGYRKTDKYSRNKGPLLGTAVAISGAAANPNQGYNTSAAVSFLMTVFDVRLGWWLGNPRRDKESMLSSPRFGLAALISELLGLTDDETRFVNLSDGGHFDNMGLYELVRRRVSFILLCDAEQDGDYKFEGLGSAIRKCRVDFGAQIEIDTVRIKPTGPNNLSAYHCAVGQIRYLDGSRGTLVYIKSSMTGDEPEDIVQYRATEKSFPHETTADQWFGESQFESYRALGYHVADESLSPATAWLAWNPEHPQVTELFDALANYWYPDNPNLKEAASKHTGALADLLDRLRENPHLHALGTELFPGGSAVAPNTLRSPIEEFYFSMCFIQLVEDLYFDFQLDRPEWFHDPRIGGWRYLFKTWKNVSAIQAAWASQHDTFRKDFQLFWDSL